MKKFLAVVLALAMVMSLAACGAKTETAPATSSAPAAQEQKKLDYPKKTINIIVPFAAGGGTDVMARAVASAVDFPEGMIITNMAGGGSSIGASEAYHADPDGYTIFCVGLEALIAGVCSGTYNEKDSFEKFIPLCSAGDDAFIITASKASGFTNLNDLVKYCKANPGKVTCAGTGSNSITNAATVLFFRACGIENAVTYVPYDGAASNRAAVMGNHEQISCLLVSEAAVGIDSGDLVPICVLGSTRSGFYPDVPCASEMGNYDINVDFHRAFFCTPGTPKEIVDALADAMEKACTKEDTQKTLSSLYYYPNYIGPDELAKVGADRYADLKEIFASFNK